VVERGCHVVEDPQRAVPRERAALDGVAERLPLHELHDDQDALFVGGRVENRHQVGVVQRRSDLGLAGEPPGNVVGTVRMQALDGHPATQPLVLAQQHGGHAARPERPDHAVAAGEESSLALNRHPERNTHARTTLIAQRRRQSHWNSRSIPVMV
jgi:hypothetical protein